MSRTGATSRTDAVVVGGGAIGLASAWRLAQRGATVTVVDPSPGSGASGVAAGMLAPVTEARLGEEPLLRLNLASWDRWPQFAADVEDAAGSAIGYRADGTVVVALDADDRVALDELAARHRAMGLEVATLRGREARGLEPGLAPSVRAGFLAAAERSVDPPALVDALRVAAAAAGVTVVTAPVARIVTTPAGDRVTGVVLGTRPRHATTAAETVGAETVGAGTVGAGTVGAGTAVSVPGGATIEAETVVLAAGCWSASVDGLPAAARPPVRPVKGQILTLRQPPGQPIITRTVRGLVHGFSVYLVPRNDGRVVVGATVEERGWDLTVTAGAAYELLREAVSLVPGLDDAELVAVRAGLRPGSPDDGPIIGRGLVDGLVIATGHYRNGILLTPITAEAVVAAVVGEPLPDVVGACDPRRFGAAAAVETASGPAADVGTAGERVRA